MFNEIKESSIRNIVTSERGGILINFRSSRLMKRSDEDPFPPILVENSFTPRALETRREREREKSFIRDIEVSCNKAERGRNLNVCCYSLTLTIKKLCLDASV
jgi:hypothetical protein